MKNIFLKSLHLYQFKGIKKLDVDFTSHSTNVSGANGTGKTTVFDAFTWLLFGKDSHDRKDFNIKSIDNTGKSAEKLEHTVAAVISVDAQEITFKRTFKENWVKKRGELDAELKGHETLFWINDVPKKAGEYAAEINEILNENVFKLITNPKYFTNQNWKQQREILFEIAGTVSDAEIANGNKEFTALLEKLNGKKLEDYRLQIISQKKLLKEQLSNLPTRIDEAEQSKPEAENYAALEKEIADKKAQISSIDDQLQNASSAYQKSFEDNQAVQNQINTFIQNQNTLVFEANQERVKTDNAIKTEKRDIQFKVDNKKSEITQLRSKITLNDSRIKDQEAKLQPLRDRFAEVNKSVYEVSETGLTCPVWNIVCGDPKSLELHKENQNKARETFNKSKVEKIDSINNEGVEITNNIKNLKAENVELQKQIDALLFEISELEKKIALYPSDDAKPNEITGKSLPEWNALQRQIDELKETIKTVTLPDNSDLKAKKSEITTEIEVLNKRLSGKELIEKQDLRIAELSAEMSKVAQQLSNLEKDEFAIDNFERVRIDESEARINNRFSFVKFKLFNRQLNGGDANTCEALIDGVPYSDANTASQINAGIDIIGVLSQFYGITAPLFLDNRESVSEILETPAQVINLIVDPSQKKLKVS